MTAPIIYGPAYSTYARTVRLVLEEKGADYRLSEVDILKGDGQKPDHVARHPWGKVPAFSHDGFTLYETAAITHYIDEALPGPKLQPSDPKRRARMLQIAAIIDSYGYAPIISRIFIQRVVTPLLGGTPDESVIAEAAPQAEKCVAALDSLADASGPFLCGPEISLADLHLVPVIAYFAQTPEGKKALSGAPRIDRWWQKISGRPSVVKTQPRLG